MTTGTGLITVEEFRGLPQDAGAIYHELRHGEVIAATRPKFKHYRIQKRLESLLEAVAGERGVVCVEFPFRPMPEHELWVADVAYVSVDRWRRIDSEDNLAGAPDLVMEILSRSNAVEMFERASICLENGSGEFWVVDPDRRQVAVTAPDGTTVTWRAGQEIVISLFGSDAALRVEEMFGE